MGGARIGDLAMKGFLFLTLMGVAIYGVLVVSHDLLPKDRAEDSLGQSLGNKGARQLRSWGSDLPSLKTSASSQATSASLPKSTALPRSVESSQNFTPAAAGGLADSQAKTGLQAGAAYLPTLAKVTIAARVHSRPYISSPIVRFYPRGTALQVVDRENGWVQVADPTSGEEGWVLEQYLIHTDRTSITQTAMATQTSKAVTEAMQTKPLPRAKKRVRTPRPEVRNPESVALAHFDRRWERRAERRGGFGLFFFGRFARAE
jgi:SH3-like domain-containing protein